MVQFHTEKVVVELVVCERLAAPVILGADFCEKQVEAVYSRRKQVELEDGILIPTVRCTLKRCPAAAPKPPELEYDRSSQRSSRKLRVAGKCVIAVRYQTWISFVANRERISVLEPRADLLSKYSL